ncbi:MAG: lipopolysaccharide biosynthesis protein [Maricaulaceae bacterium]|nr:lipopolysaccharide biosynthesis protein [Maricaulaceae bacterium]
MLGRHLLGYLPMQAAQAIVGFGGIVVLTRLLPPEEYGRYALVLAAMHLTHMALFTWLESAVARFHARADKRGGLAAHLASAYGAWLAAAALALVLGGLGIWLAPLAADLKTALGFGLAALVVRALGNIGLETHRAAGRVARYSGLESLVLLLGFGLGVGFIIATPLGAAGPFAGMALGALAALLIDLPSHLNRAKNSAPKPKRARIYLAYGLPISASLVFEHLLSVGDRFLIAGFLDEAAVGLYAAGYGMADRVMNILFVWMGMALTPLLISALEREGPQAARDVALRAARIMGLVAFPAAAGLALVAAPLAGVMVGEDFREGAAMIAPWIALAGLMNGLMTYYFHEAFILKRRTGMMAAMMAGAAVLNLVLNIALLPLFGITGAAIATVIAYGAGLTACALIGRRLFPLPVPLRDWGKAALATAGMALAVIAVPGEGPAILTLLIKAGAGAAVYAALALALNVAGCRGWIRDARLALKPAETAA